MLPRSVEARIVIDLDTETAQFDSFIVEAERAIDLLQERLITPISVAVPGKLDVRGLAESEAA